MRGAIVELKIEECRAIELVDVYEGEGVPEGKRSVTLRLEYQADDRTLRDAEVDSMHGRVLDELKSRTDAQPRE